jgi:hypothetical protein
VCSFSDCVSFPLRTLFAIDTGVMGGAAASLFPGGR